MLSHLLVHWILGVVYLVVLVLGGSWGTLSSVWLLHVVKVLLIWLVLHILRLKLEGVMGFNACHLLVIPTHWECLSVILPIYAQRRVDESSTEIIVVLLGWYKRAPLDLSLWANVVLSVIVSIHIEITCVLLSATHMILLVWYLVSASEPMMVYFYIVIILILDSWALLLFLLILKLCDKAIASRANLSSLVTSLILVDNIFLVDDWHVSKSGHVVGLDNEHGASYLDDIVDF